MTILTTILTILTSIPQIYKLISLTKPIKDKVIEVEDISRKVEGLVPEEIRKNKNSFKHNKVYESILQPTLDKLKKKYGLNKDDIDIIIKCVVMVVKKIGKRYRK